MTGVQVGTPTEQAGRVDAQAPVAPASADAGPGGTGAVNRADQRRVRRLGLGRRRRFSRALGTLLVLGVWAAGSAAGRFDPRTLPAPWTVVNTGWNLWAHGTLQDDMATSATRAGWGFAIGLALAVTLALVAGLSRLGESVVDGPVQLVRSVPPLALVPLMILWLGIGEQFKVVIIAFVVFVPIYMNLYAALSRIDSRYVELAETLRLSRWRFLRSVVIPGALPGFFVGLRLGATNAWLALVILEQINATSGLGYRMFQAQNYGQSDVILVGITIYALLGLFSDSVIRAFERRVLSWQRTLSA
jgi:sulfonate transport system permease protein